VSSIEIRPLSAPPDATISVPGSKSLSNRALLAAALADGACTLTGALYSDDTRLMAGALRTLGVEVVEDEAGERFQVGGTGGRVPAIEADLFIGNSGTTARFLTGYVALGRGRYRIDGAPRMRERPIQPLLDALGTLGVHAVSESGTGCPPVVVEVEGIRGGKTEISGSLSSQYLTSLLLVAPYMVDGLDVAVAGALVSRPYIDLTIGLMADFGVTVEEPDPNRFLVRGGQRYAARHYAVEPDASAASYFFAAAAVTGGRVCVPGLGTRTQQGDLNFVDVLERMGCTVSRSEEAVEVVGPRRLRGVDVDMGGISDTAQTLAAIAPFADAPVRITGVAHNRVKETDRVGAVATELRRLGVRVEERPDGMTIFPSPVRPAEVETYDDHRMAMSFAVTGLAAPGVRIRNPECVSKTFPRYFETLAKLAATP
jgi:3-phosphoshikimate 1-carboxyvinyltransferase